MAFKGGTGLNMQSQDKALRYTISHFKEIARRNLFAENAKIPHDNSNCAICNPGIIGEEAFPVYLEVIVSSILVRRPQLDETLVAEVNRDRAMAGLPADLTVKRFLTGDRIALDSWIAWVREALSTGLGLLSVHSSTSIDFDLEEQVEAGNGALIQSKIKFIVDQQMKTAQKGS